MILAVNTSTTRYGIALLQENGAVVAEAFNSPGSKNFNNLMPELHHLFSTSDWKLEDLAAVVVAMGPGSFTGLRVGLAMTKGLCQGLEIPIIGVSSLEAMASQLPHARYPVCPLVASRKGEAFTALFHWSEDLGVEKVKDEISLRFDDFSSFVEGRTLFLGSDLDIQGPLIKKALGHQAILAPGPVWNLKASALGVLGLKRFLEQDFDDLRDLVPAYLRPPDISPNPLPPIANQGPGKAGKEGAQVNNSHFA